MLLVGNMTYGPNIAAAEILVREVLPRVERLIEQDVRVELVGAYAPGGAVERLSGDAAVDVRGYVEDLDDAYARADVVVVPLREGAGTRIKILEAFAVGVPVVATTVAASGLGAADGRHLLLADGPEEIAAAVARLAYDEALVDTLVREARTLVTERFSVDVVGETLRELVRTLR
jgi:glycosyltransferase involved in cell wall biosynthesis